MTKRRGVKVVPQKHVADCGLCCLAMLFAMPYGDVSAAARAIWGDSQREQGLAIGEIEELAEALGRTLRRVCRRKDYLADQTGVLGLIGGKMRGHGHWVVLTAGTIVDPAGGEVWPIEAYCAAHKARTGTLLVEA